MIQIEFTDQQRVVLSEFLESGLTNMHSEIMHTSSLDYKNELKEKRDLLNDILQSLKQTD